MSSLEDSFDTPDDVLAGEAAEGKRRPAPEHVLWPVRPLDVARVQGLRGEIGPVGMEPAKELRFLGRRGENLHRQASIQVSEMGADGRFELRVFVRESALHLSRIGGAGKWSRGLVEPPEPELGAELRQH